MSAVAVIPSLIPLIVVAAMRRAEAQIHRQLSEAGAVTAQTAIPLTPSRSLERRRLPSLVDGGAVRLTADGRYFLDADGWSRYRSHRRRRALLAASVVVALLGLGVGVFFVMQ